MALDTQVPGWLQRNWSPRESFDPTPWLQERYRRQEHQEQMALKVQQFGLQAQASQLAIQQASMANEQASKELAVQNEELPSFNQWVDSGAFDGPLPRFRSQTLMERAIAMRKAHAQSSYAKAMEEYETGLIKVAAELVAKGKNVRPREVGGRMVFDPDELSAAASELDEREQQQLLSRVKAQYGQRHSMTVPPDVKAKVDRLKADINLLHRERLKVEPNQDGSQSKRFRLATMAANKQKEIETLLAPYGTGGDATEEPATQPQAPAFDAEYDIETGQLKRVAK